MMKTQTLVPILMWATILLSANLLAQSQETININNRELNVPQLEASITQMMANMGVPGMSLAIIEQNEVVYAKNFGLKHIGGPAVNENTVFDGCSLSKSLLVHVAMQLVDEGKLDLDKPMYQYYESGLLAHDPRYKLITPRMILSHSSGLENWMYQNSRDTLELLADPGTTFTYSGVGYHYLATVIGDILDQRYEAYVTERVINKLGLKNTYLKYVKDGEQHQPENHALGHQLVGFQYTDKNFQTVPAGGNHFTAHDYAQLVLATYNGKHLTAARNKDLYDPRVPIENSDIYYAPGFEYGVVSGDTIISHGGDKDGYKNMMFYSASQQRGFVFMSNIDWGKAMTQKLNELTVNLPIEPFLNSRYYLKPQYPNQALPLLKLANETGYDTLHVEVEKQLQNGQLTMADLHYLTYIMRWYGNVIEVRDLLKKTIEQYPNDAFLHALLGESLMVRQAYHEAHQSLTKAQQLGFTEWSLTADINKSKRLMAEVDRREKLLVNIEAKRTTTIEAEEYNHWGGLVYVEVAKDDGIEKCLGDFDTGNWVSFDVDVQKEQPYEVMIRFASPVDNNELEFLTDDNSLVKMKLPPTEGWNGWQSITTKLVLPPGRQSLKIVANAGAFRVNWLQLKPAELPKAPTPVNE